jgi:hypothetical protein
MFPPVSLRVKHSPMRETAALLTLTVVTHEYQLMIPWQRSEELQRVNIVAQDMKFANS